MKSIAQSKLLAKDIANIFLNNPVHTNELMQIKIDNLIDKLWEEKQSRPFADEKNWEYICFIEQWIEVKRLLSI